MLQAYGSHRSIWPLLTALAVCLATIIAMPLDARAASGKLRLSKSSRLPDILVMMWGGEVRPGMAEKIRTAFDKYKDRFHAIELVLDSPGGNVHEGEKVIEVLQSIKKTHRLYTIVMAGKKCGSMCPFIYMQGQKRFAAPASIWLFHEVSRSDKRTHKIYELDRAQWERLIDKYWLPAGVNPVWIAEMKKHTFQRDYYQTGQDLLDHDAGIVHKPLSNELPRKVVPKETAHQL